jgi:ACT domain-containing protein
LKVSKRKKSIVPSLTQVLKPVNGAANVNITVNINKFEKNVGAVIQTGGTQNINEIIDIKTEE